MRRTLAVFGALLFLTAPAAAQPVNTIDVNPGFIGPDSTLYGIQIAIDSTLVDWGIKDAGDVAHQRASEALISAEAGDTEAMERALAGLSIVADAATQDHADGLEQAESLLVELRELTGDNPGIDEALNRVQDAQDRTPETERRLPSWELGDRIPV